MKAPAPGGRCDKIKLDPAAEKDVLEKYIKIIRDEFFLDRGFGKLRYSVSCLKRIWTSNTRTG